MQAALSGTIVSLRTNLQLLRVRGFIQGECNLLLFNHKSSLFSHRQCGRSLFLVLFPWHKRSLPLHPCVCKRSDVLSDSILHRGPWVGGWRRSRPHLQAGVRPCSRAVATNMGCGRLAGFAVRKWRESFSAAGLVSYDWTSPANDTVWREMLSWYDTDMSKSASICWKHDKRRTNTGQ